MKKTTVIMIAIAVGVLIAIEGLILYGATYLQPFDNRYIVTSDETVEIPLRPFTSLKLRGTYSPDVDLPNQAPFVVSQSDSVDCPTLIISENLAEKIDTVFKDGKFIFSFRESDDVTSGEILREIIKFTRPITLRVPSMPDSITNEFIFPVTLSGKSKRKITLSTRGNFNFVNVDLDSLTITGQSNMTSDDNKPGFENSRIGHLLIHDYRRPFFIQSDSISRIKVMTILGQNDYEQKFTPGNMQIDKFTFIPADSMSRITLTDYHTLTTPFNR